ncbi:MAG: RecX family transcriptional regulator [Chloroflexi bacterium]|nr:RecX family transcriptional regulator [Chloroflexota bacterium]MBU1748416.1 RecX family transcriptional regulator [Chloroflexota bacterium]
MSQITALERQKKNPRRVNVYLDGHFALGLDGVLAAELRVGQPLTEADLDRLAARDTVERAQARAVDFLARRPRSEAEVRQRLSQKGFAPVAIDQVLDRLRELNLVDDLAFARFWVENRLAFRPRGARGLEYELRQKGVAPAIIQQVLDDVPGDEATRAYRVARSRAERLAASAAPRPDFQRKLGGLLQRRGFDYESAREAIDQLWRDLALDSDEPA